VADGETTPHTNQQTGPWEVEPVFLDLEAFNRGETGRQMADLAEQYFRKGQQVFIEGHLKLDQWTGQDGQKRSRLKIVVDNFQFLEPRGEGGGGRSTPAPAMGRKPAGPTPGPGFDEPEPEPEAVEPPEARSEDHIPF